MAPFLRPFSPKKTDVLFGEKSAMKRAPRVVVEALVVGLLLAAMMFVVCKNRDSWMVPESVIPAGLASTTAAAFVCGAAFHVICEVTGLNEWYARTYFE
jgi:hypothetical protein